MQINLSFSLLGNSITVDETCKPTLITVDNKDKLLDVFKEGLRSLITTSHHLGTHLISTSDSGNIYKIVEEEDLISLLKSHMFIDVVGQSGLSGIEGLISNKEAILKLSYPNHSIESMLKLNERRGNDLLPLIYPEVVFLNGVSRINSSHPNTISKLLKNASKLGIIIIAYDFNDNIDDKLSDKFPNKYNIVSKYSIESIKR